ncbi:TrmH family RNA methyltransferase [Staphylococcus pettenkoferi]
MEQITSTQNSKVKAANKLKKKRERDKTGYALIEGYHLIEEAMASDIQIVSLFCVEAERKDAAMLEYADAVYKINLKVAELLSGTVTPQGIFAVIQQPTVQDRQPSQVLLIDRIQDPGNLGTLIRTADAAGLDMVVLEKGSADPYQEKVLRASQGSVFHLPIIQRDLKTFIDDFEGPVYGTALQDAVEYQTVEQQDKFALILGNEGEGIKSELLDQTTQNLTIPIYGRAESLNVAIAGSILIYHLKG